MPRYNDYFRSHLFPGDPRTPLTAAGGCIWPTIPAHRYLLKSQDATGVLTGLNTEGILIEKVTPGEGHDSCQYLMIAGPVPVTFCIVWKHIAADRNGYRWTIGISATGCGIIEGEVIRPRETCNRDFLIGSLGCSMTSDHTGATFTAYQVVFDETNPPVYP